MVYKSFSFLLEPNALLAYAARLAITGRVTREYKDQYSMESGHTSPYVKDLESLMQCITG